MAQTSGSEPVMLRNRKLRRSRQGERDRSTGRRQERESALSGRVLSALALHIVVFLLVACTAPPGPLPPRPPERGLRVMTFNVLGAQGDGRVFSEQAGWAARIDQHRPDVVVLQEAQGDDVAAVRGLTITDYTLASYLQWECDLKPEREGVAILVRSTIAVLASGGTHVGESCLDPTVQRVLVWADLEVAGAPFRVYGTHLTAGEAASAASRDAQIREIRRIVSDADAARDGRWVLAGDLNAAPGTSSYDLLIRGDGGASTATRLVDTYAELSPAAADAAQCPVVDADDVPGMQFLWDNPDHVRRCGYTAGWPKDSNWLLCDLLSLCTSWDQRRVTSVRNRVDMVLRSENGPVAVRSAYVPNRTERDWAVPGVEWYRLSDHLPYVVDLAIGSDRPSGS